MKKILTLIMLSSSFSVLGLFSVPSIAGDSETPKYSDEQLQKLKAAEEKYKDNPQVLKIISNIKANSGITDEVVLEKDPEPTPIMAHGEVISQGSYQKAEEAFRNNDNETAIAHYKVLAAQGDPEASLKLGYIYEQEGDSKAAYAAYKKASESEDINEDSKMAAERLKWLEKDVMNQDEIDQANQLLEESSQISGASTVKNTNSLQYKPVTASSRLGANPPTKPVYHIQSIKPRAVKVTPERVSKYQHFKPEKFTRTPES